MKRLLQAVVATAVLAAAVLTHTARAQGTAQTGTQLPQLLFVQSASSAEFGAGGRTLTLKGIAPTTLFFTDRPVRMAGHFRNDEYLEFWKGGPDSFRKDPPNATLSLFLKGRDEPSDVVMTLRNPRIAGSDLTYDVSILQGAPPQGGGPVSLFIDIIGLPFTPLSFAGVARRTAARTVVWGSAASAATAAAYAYPYYYAPPPVVYTPPAVQVTDSVQAPPAQTATVAKLKELKSLQSRGLITEAQYQAESQKLLNELVQ